jgi:hypothetical protein
MTLGAVVVLAACASDPQSVATAPRAAAATTTTPRAPAATNVSTGSLGGQSAVALRSCVNALVDDPSAPGVNFVDKLKKLSVGYSMVEPLNAAQALCSEASAQLEAESTTVDPPSPSVLADTKDINTALDLAARQIRNDGFYYGGSQPAQFIPDGATALRQSIEVFYSRASAALR